MLLPTQLPAHVLADIVSHIQQLLWLETDESGDSWNGDKEWDSETLEYVARVLDENRLRPAQPWIGPTIVVN